MLERQKENNEENCQLLKKENCLPSSTDKLVNPFMLPANMNSKYLGYEEVNSYATESNTKEADNL